jgi:hypothetical protein
MPTPFPDDVRGFIESTAWTFAKTYAATWPHEYVVRTPQNAAMVVALARHIFEHGVDGRFYSQVRKYHHEAGKVYWSMDDAPEGTGLVKLASERRLRRLGMLTLGQVLLLALAETNPFFFATIPLQILLARHEWKKWHLAHLQKRLETSQDAFNDATALAALARSASPVM